MILFSHQHRYIKDEGGLRGLSTLQSSSIRLRVACQSTYDALFKEYLIKSELLSYEDVLFEETTEDWYAQRPEDIVECIQRQCIQLAYHFYCSTEPYR